MLWLVTLGLAVVNVVMWKVSHDTWLRKAQTGILAVGTVILFVYAVLDSLARLAS